MTHKGWFGLCPVHTDMAAEPMVVPRHWAFCWLFDLSLVLFEAAIRIALLMNPAFEPAFGLIVTGKLKEPFEVEKV